ncbi:MAG: class I SAM-dependent methyltransferase [Casimicrobiaceae bacterium]
MTTAMASTPGTTHAALARACLVCGGARLTPRWEGLLACPDCGFLSADMALSDAELSDLYGRDYFHGHEYLDYIEERESLQINFRARLKTLAELIPDLAAKKLFEIGCAYGFFLETVRGNVAAAAGIDISQDAITYATGTLGVRAVAGDYLTHVFAERPDVIAMWDTVEHLRRPDLFVAKAARDLPAGGHLALTTGDIGSLNARWRGRRWRMIHPPSHLHYFSADTMSRLLDRHGFDVVHVSHPGNSRTVRSILYIILALRLGRRGIYERLARLRVSGSTLTINLFDIMFVIARRRSHIAKASE